MAITETDSEFISLTEGITGHPEFCKLREFNHHGVSIYNHSLRVARLSYNMACRFSLDREAAAVGGLLHDFFLYDWHRDALSRRRFYEIHRMHGFTHARTALENADQYFDLYDRTRDAILRHMFPLTLKPPIYRESWAVTVADKIVTLREIVENLKRRKSPGGYPG